MANKFTKYLSDFGSGLLSGITNPKGGMSNWQHATRLFVDDTFRLAPKTKFNYYVHFDIDPQAVKSPGFSNQTQQEVGYLVKTTDLPKYRLQTQTLNQYNRKKIIHTNYSYEPINISLHDDNNGNTNALWALYWGYYVRDRGLPTIAHGSTHYRSADDQRNGFRYGLDNDISVPFLRAINIYTMGRRRFIGYSLINPRITNWNHGNRDHADGQGTAQSDMTVEYENVIYSAGSVSQNSPKGFADLHYDVTPSPLSIAGGGVSNLLGEGGVLDGIESVFGALSSGAAFDSPGNFLGTVGAAINTYNNARNLSTESLLQEGARILTTPGAVDQIVGGISGAVGSIFPTSGAQTEETVATQTTITSGAQTFAAGTNPAPANQQGTFQ